MRGPSFGNGDLFTIDTLLVKHNLWSFVEREGFGIGGKVGKINPLTGYIIVRHEDRDPHSRSTAIDIEVWQIETKAE